MITVPPWCKLKEQGQLSQIAEAENAFIKEITLLDEASNNHAIDH
jgi:hypothetical protein